MKPKKLMNADSADQPHIAMDLACGLFDLNTKEAATQAERAMSGAQALSATFDEPKSTSEGSSSFGDTEESDSECESNHGSCVMKRKRKLKDGGCREETHEDAAQRKSQKIEEL